MFHLITSSGVNYDGGHWFHVAENFMVQHTLLRQREKDEGIGLATSSEVFLSLDRDSFIAETNSMTRFMLALGMTNGEFNKLHLFHSDTLDLTHTRAKPGDSMFVPASSLEGHQVGFL